MSYFSKGNYNLHLSLHWNLHWTEHLDSPDPERFERVKMLKLTKRLEATHRYCPNRDFVQTDATEIEQEVAEEELEEGEEMKGSNSIAERSKYLKYLK
jgi:hypothetical protein